MGKSKNKSAKGADGFDEYYTGIYKERWPALRAALFEPVRYVMLPAKSPSNVKEYFLDAASVVAALMLPLDGCVSVLDLCAAPGGKSIILAQRMSDSGEGMQIGQKTAEKKTLPDLFVCNEISGARRARLTAVLNTYTDPIIRERIKITGFDGARLCRFEQESFDAVLLDAPCSSERHVLQDAKYLAQWSPARVKHLAQTQWALLSSAFRLLKKGAHILYATCALAPQENDGTVQKLLKKFENARPVFTPTPLFFSVYALPSCEKTEYGFHILPDVQKGSGPLYFSLIQKI